MNDHENHQTKTRMSPKDFFLWLAAMVALYISVISFLTLLFEYIETLFPDVLEGHKDPYSGGIRFAIASLVVIFPLYVFLMRVLNNDLRCNPEKRNLGIRKWLTYFTLFAAGIAIIVDLVILINTFLGGELTTRFILKILAVLVVVGGVFTYYFYSLRGKWEEEANMSARIGWVVSSVVFGTIVSGFFITGSPVSQREFRFDERKVSDLQSLQWQIVNFWQIKRALPTTLEALNDPLVGFISPRDPQSGEEYGYRVLGSLSFELCATFNREGPRYGNAIYGRYPVPLPASRAKPIDSLESTWEHGEGEVCFERTIDPERFPPFERIKATS